MSHWLRNALTAATLFTLTVPAWAQEPPKPDTTPANPAPTTTPAPARQARRGGRNGRALGLATLPVAVLDMVSPLKDDQKTKITDIQAKAKTDVAAAADPAAKTAVTTKAVADVKAMLTTDQANAVEKALPMLRLINSSKVVPLAALPELKLTREQMDKINALTEQENAKLTGLKGADRSAKNKEMYADFKTQVEGLLTTGQKDTLVKYEAAHPAGKKKNAAPPA